MEHMSFEDEDFVIRVRPSLNGDEWTGEIDISIISQASNPLNDEGYNQVMHFCKMMCATIPLMEQNDDLRTLVHTYVMEVVDNDHEDVVEDEEGLILLLILLPGLGLVPYFEQGEDNLLSPFKTPAARLRGSERYPRLANVGYNHSASVKFI